MRKTSCVGQNFCFLFVSLVSFTILNHCIYMYFSTYIVGKLSPGIGLIFYAWHELEVSMNSSLTEPESSSSCCKYNYASTKSVGNVSSNLSVTCVRRQLNVRLPRKFNQRADVARSNHVHVSRCRHHRRHSPCADHVEEKNQSTELQISLNI